MSTVDGQDGGAAVAAAKPAAAPNLFLEPLARNFILVSGQALGTFHNLQGLGNCFTIARALAIVKPWQVSSRALSASALNGAPARCRARMAPAPAAANSANCTPLASQRTQPRCPLTLASPQYNTCIPPGHRRRHGLRGCARPLQGDWRRARFSHPFACQLAGRIIAPPHWALLHTDLRCAMLAQLAFQSFFPHFPSPLLHLHPPALCPYPSIPPPSWPPRRRSCTSAWPRCWRLTLTSSSPCSWQTTPSQCERAHAPPARASLPCCLLRPTCTRRPPLPLCPAACFGSLLCLLRAHTRTTAHQPRAVLGPTSCEGRCLYPFTGAAHGLAHCAPNPAVKPPAPLHPHPPHQCDLAGALRV